MEKEDKTTTNADDIAKESEQAHASNTVTPKKKNAGKRLQWLTVLVIIMVSIGASVWLLWLQPLLKSQQFVASQKSALTQPFSSNIKPAPQAQAKKTDIHDDIPSTNLQASSITIEYPPQKKEIVAQKNNVITAHNANSIILPASPEPTIAKAAEKHVVLTDKPNPAEVPQTIINHGNTEELHQELTQLHADITILRTAITVFHQQQAVQLRKQLSNNLNQLLSPRITFSQQAMLWQNIGNQSQLPIAQQQQALAMMKLAQQNVAIATQWQTKLQNMLLALHNTTPMNIIPHDYWWQKWIREHVSLHRLTSENTQQNERIIAATKNIITRLSQAQWPDAGTWQHLYQHIANKSMASSLADNIAIVEKNTTTMHQLAKQWRDQP